jgi:hypothetical protein
MAKTSMRHLPSLRWARCVEGTVVLSRPRYVFEGHFIQVVTDFTVSRDRFLVFHEKVELVAPCAMASHDHLPMAQG